MEDTKWLAGAIMTLVTMIGGLITRDRQVMAKIEDGDKELRAELNAVKRAYVRRDDLKEHLQAIERMLAQAREDQKDLTRRIDGFISSVNNTKRGE